MDNHNPIVIQCCDIIFHHQIACIFFPLFICFLPSLFMVLVLDRIALDTFSEVLNHSYSHSFFKLAGKRSKNEIIIWLLLC